jgi:exonuclease III
MKKTDHSTFIMNHRQDFLKIYDTKWIDVFNHLKKRNKVFVILLENLMINIPTAFKIANA